jgi:AraC-like DNA-binding protein
VKQVLKLNPDLIARLKLSDRWLRKNAANSPSLLAMSKPSGISMFHFQRLYKLHFGKTPKQVLDELRIERARKLLDGPDPLPEVAIRAGFSSLSHFTTRFGKLTGETPASCRKRIKWQRWMQNPLNKARVDAVMKGLSDPRHLPNDLRWLKLSKPVETPASEAVSELVQ